MSSPAELARDCRRKRDRRRRSSRDPAAPAIAVELRRIRQQKAISQCALDASIGCREGNVSYWERGMIHPGIGNLEAWAGALGYKLALEESEGHGNE